MVDARERKKELAIFISANRTKWIGGDYEMVDLSVSLSLCLCTRIGGDMHSNERLVHYSLTLNCDSKKYAKRCLRTDRWVKCHCHWSHVEDISVFQLITGSLSGDGDRLPTSVSRQQGVFYIPWSTVDVPDYRYFWPVFWFLGRS